MTSGSPFEDPRREAGIRGGHIVADPEAFAKTAATFLGRKLASFVERGGASVALSGGSTPGLVYDMLAEQPNIDWREVDVFFTDERVVPLDHAQSNYRLVRETLLDRVDIPLERVHPMPVGEPRLEEAARAYSQSLPDRIDLLILGLGVDGHTASLFPGAPALTSELPVAPVTAPVEPFRRLTITPQVIASARLVIMLVRGEDKADAVGNALREGGSVEACPGRLANRAIWIIGSDTVRAMRGARLRP